MSDDNDDVVHFDLESALLNETPPADSSTPVKNTEKVSLRDTLSRGDTDLTKSADDDAGATDTDDIQDDTDPLAAKPEVPDNDADPDSNDPAVDVFAKAAELGLPNLKEKYKTQADAIEAGLHAMRLVGQRNQYADYGRQLLENPQAVLESLKKLYDKQQDDKVAAPVVKKSDVPEYDEAWKALFDEEGKLVPGADPTIPSKIRKYNEYVSTKLTKFALDPEAELLPVLEARIAKLADERAQAIVSKESEKLRQEQAQHETLRTAHSLVQEEASWAFVEGDIRKGPTAEGKVLGKWLQILETPDASGNIPIPDMRTRKEVAVLMARNELSAAAASDNPGVRKKQQSKITKKPNRSATEPTDKSWPKGLSLEEALARTIDAT